jgi:KUP system potassium uptake protein
LPELLARCGLRTNPVSTYYLGRENLLTTGESKMAPLPKQLFLVPEPQRSTPTGFFSLPSNRVVELGTQIEL